jgi:hypothetical protein
MFMDAKSNIIEEQINAWLDYLSSATINDFFDPLANFTHHAKL